MARVAQNQDRAEQGRSRYVYLQTTAVRIRDTNNRLTCEELTRSEVYPAPDGTQHKELTFAGRSRDGKQMRLYTKSGEPMAKGIRQQVDAQLAQSLRDDLSANKKSKDGFSPDLFPLTTHQQTRYTFQLAGELTVNSIPVYRITFQPRQTQEDENPPWAGEAFISREDFEPVQISTKLAHGIPFLVRTALGTNVRGLGFTVSYRKLEEGVWFPSSYGAEFEVRVVFFIYNRKIALSLANTDFVRTASDSTVTFEK